MKNAVEVVVDGRVYKISGYESQEYMHQIAVYINEKMTQCHNTENYRKQSSDMLAVDAQHESWRTIISKPRIRPRG